MKKIIVLLIALLVPIAIFAEGMGVNVVNTTSAKAQGSGYDTYPDGAIKIVPNKEIIIPNYAYLQMTKCDLVDDVTIFLNVLNINTSKIDLTDDFKMTVTVDGRFVYTGSEFLYEGYNRWSHNYFVEPLYERNFYIQCNLPKSVFSRFSDAPIIVDFDMLGQHFRYQAR